MIEKISMLCILLMVAGYASAIICGANQLQLCAHWAIVASIVAGAVAMIGIAIMTITD